MHSLEDKDSDEYTDTSPVQLAAELRSEVSRLNAELTHLRRLYESMKAQDIWIRLAVLESRTDQIEKANRQYDIGPRLASLEAQIEGVQRSHVQFDRRLWQVTMFGLALLAMTVVVLQRFVTPP